MSDVRLRIRDRVCQSAHLQSHNPQSATCPTSSRSPSSRPPTASRIVVARWNEAITRKLLDGAVATLREHGVADDAIDVAWVPGSFEIPLVAQRLADVGPLSRPCSAWAR